MLERDPFLTERRGKFVSGRTPKPVCGTRALPGNAPHEVALALRRSLADKGAMLEPLSNAQKRELKAQAQRLDPVVKLGHGGLSAAFLKSIDEALSTHGLVKMKFTDFKEERKTLAPEIAARTGSALVMQVGNVAVFFRPKPQAP